MNNSTYPHYEAEAKARQSSPLIDHPNGNIRLDSLGNFEFRYNLRYGPLPITYSREHSLALADAIYRLHGLTAPSRPEE
jgi:hypothetical protein